MLLPTPLQPLPLNRPFVPHTTQAPPYSPTLINLNQRYNMSANSLTEALLLLSGMYISLVQPDPGPVKVGLHGVFPETTGSFLNAITDPFTEGNKRRTFMRYQAIPTAFNISSSFTRSKYAPKDVLHMLCEQIFPKNTITMFYVNNHLSLREYTQPAVSYLPKVIESLGLPIISYDTQFSPNARPKLSIQLAPTMGQMMDVMFAFLRRFEWTHFSFLCTLSYGCQDEISFIKLKIDEFKRTTKLSVYGVEMFSYELLSYVNFTNGENETEVKEKLMYELHKDSRINLFHGNGSEVKAILDVAKTLGLTGKDYVWIFTAASITLSAAFVDESYPLGSFIIGYDASREIMTDVVKTGVNLWLDALNSLAVSSDLDGIDFTTGFSCDAIKEDMAREVNETMRSPLFWKYGEVLYRYILKSKLPGDLEFDEYGVLKANKFFIMNVQRQTNTTSSRDDSSDRRTPGRAADDSPRRSSGSIQQRGSEHSSYSRTGGEDKDSGSPISRGRESRFPISRDKPSGSPLNRDRGHDVDQSLPRYRVSEPSESRKSGYQRPEDNAPEIPVSTDEESGSHEKDSGSVSRLKFSGSPSSRDGDFRSRFSQERDSKSLSRDGESEPVSSATKESGPPYTKDRRSSSVSHDNAPESGRSSSKVSSSDTSFNYDPSHNAIKNGTALFLDSSLSSISSRDNSSEFASELSFPNKNGAYGSSYTPFPEDQSSNRRHGLGRSDEDFPSRSSGPFGHARIRHRERENAHRSRGSHKTHAHESDKAADWEHESHDNSLGTIQSGEPHERSSRATSEKQIAQKIADWDGHNLIVQDITWPGGASKPPKGKPEKYILKVVTWQEDPHVIYREMTTGLNDEKTCELNSIRCTVYNRDKSLQRTNGTSEMCCTGLCIDLLMRLGEMLNFDVELSEADGSYGSPLNVNNTDWTGMLGMLIHKEADMAVGALSITPERSVAVDFSVPFLQTGITIIVALRQGVISPAAFLEPYDYPSWSLILLFSVHATGTSIFIFEWLSPYGLDQGKTSYSVHKFSLFRSFWLIWAMLFGASVSTDQPRGIASRFLANIWALFAVVFCASYTANLAAFMITKDAYHDLSGIQDWRLKNPHHTKPPFKFATIANSSTDLNIKKNYKDIHQYMKNDPQTDVKGAIVNLKNGNIQAFIYDSTTLEYEVGKDDGCKLKTVGKRIAETGYGVAFPKKSPWVKEVDGALLKLQETGEIERLQKHWLARACHNKKETGVSSHTLGILNFTSAFVLLGSGVILGVLVLVLEHMYFRFGRKSLKKWDKCGCCSLVSLSMGQSLTFEQSVMEAMDYHKHHRCKDPLCETQLWKVKHDLDIALLKISQLRRQLAYSASGDATRGGGHGASPRYESEASQHQNAAARRRRQQASDAGSGKMDRSVNQPLLALEGKSETDEDNTPVQSPKRKIGPVSPRSSFPVAKSKVDGKDNDREGRYSYPEQRSQRETARRASEDLPVNNMTPQQRNHKIPGDVTQKVTDLDLHPPPPSFDEAMSRYRSSPTDVATPSPSPPLPSPPSSPPPPAVPTPPHHSPQGGLSDSNTSNSLPSSDDKRYEPFILDSPESPSFSSFSETSDNRLSCPGTLSKLSDEIPSTAVSQDMDSNFTSSPEMSKSLDDSNIVPSVAYAGTQFSNAQYKHPASSIDSIKPSILREDVKPDTQMALLNSSKEADNDVNTRQNRNNDGNIYVNVDDIAGKETSF